VVPQLNARIGRNGIWGKYYRGHQEFRISRAASSLDGFFSGMRSLIGTRWKE
jgi:hypothetical protein